MDAPRFHVRATPYFAGIIDEVAVYPTAPLRCSGQQSLCFWLADGAPGELRPNPSAVAGNETRQPFRGALRNRMALPVTTYIVTAFNQRAHLAKTRFFSGGQRKRLRSLPAWWVGPSTTSRFRRGNAFGNFFVFGI